MKPIAIIGLGNPGSKYQDTRHNIGHLVIDDLAKRFRVSAKPGKGKFVYGSFQSRGDNFYIAKLTTYMNNSGEGIKDFMSFIGVSPKQLLVVYDDFALDFGSIRLRKAGSDGGHNGMFSIIASLGTTDIPRLRMGIGPVGEYVDPADFVLDTFSDTEKDLLPDFIRLGVKACSSVLYEGFDRTMNKFNKKPEMIDDAVEQQEVNNSKKVENSHKGD